MASKTGSTASSKSSANKTAITKPKAKTVQNTPATPRDDMTAENISVKDLKKRDPHIYARVYKEKILEASKNGNFADIQQLLAEKPNPNPNLAFTAEDAYGNSPLYLAACGGHQPAMETLIKNEAPVNKTNKDGQTPLHAAAAKGRIDAMDLLVKHKASLDYPDVNGQTPLHAAAAKGMVDAMDLLVKHKASLDYPDVKCGQTPLHLAVLGSFTEAASFLLFCGSNMGIRDKNGNTAPSLVQGDDMKNMVDNAQLLAKGNKLGLVKMQSLEVKHTGNAEFDELGLTVEYSKDSDGDETFDMRCRKQPIEYTDEDFRLQETDSILSDVYVYRLRRKGSGQLLAKLQISLFQSPQFNECVVLRTNTEQEYEAEIIEKHNETWYAVFSVDLSSCDAFMVVTTEKRDFFEVSQQATTITSSMDEQVEMHIQEGTFENATKITLEILTHDIGLEEDEEEEGMQPVLSTTSFYSITTDGGTAPAKEMDLLLPLPALYNGNGRLLIASATTDDDEYDELDEEDWKILDVTPAIVEKRIQFAIESFSVKVAVEAAPNSETSSIIAKINSMYNKVKRREHEVAFLAMPQTIGFGEAFKLAIECVLAEKAEARRDHWLAEGYKEQHPSTTAHVTAVAKQTFKVKINDKIRLLGDLSDITLQFHPKRENYQVFAIDLLEGLTSGVGQVQIYPGHKPGETAAVVPSEILTNIVIELKRLNMDRRGTMNSMSTTDSEYFSGNYEEGRNFKGFTCDAFLKDVSLELADEWMKVCLLLGIPYNSVELALADTVSSEEDRSLEILTKWRNINLERDDLGVPLLLSALMKGGHYILSKDVRRKMYTWKRSWDQTEEETDYRNVVFAEWLEKTENDQTLFDPNGDYPEPMSDAFITLLAEELMEEAKKQGETMPSLEFARSLGLKKSEFESVLNDIRCRTEHQQMIKTLLAVRSKLTRTTAFKAIMDVLQTFNITSTRHWMALVTQRWLKQNPDLNDTFTATLQEIIDSAERDTSQSQKDDKKSKKSRKA